jgi:hypothetical protein
MSVFDKDTFIAYRTVPSIDTVILKEKFNGSVEDINNKYNPFHVTSIQNYQPIHSFFFNMNEGNYNSFQLNHVYHFKDFDNVIDPSGDIISRKTFIKYSPLTDPVRYLLGKLNKNKYDMINLPKLNDTSSNYTNVDNASYIDGFFSFLCSHTLHKHNFINSIDYHGSFLAVQDKFKFNITDDYEYLNDSKHFISNMDVLYSISKDNICDLNSFDTRSKRIKLDILETLTDIIISVDDTESIIVDSSSAIVNNDISLEEVYIKLDSERHEDDDNKSDDSESDDSESDDSESDDSESDDSESDDSESEDDEIEDDEIKDDEIKDDESDDDESDDDDMYAYINNFPVQMICLEQCDGTLDSLLEKDLIDEQNGCSALMQVLLSLLTYQKMFNFTHNDLHTNNIMYTTTKQEFLYYKVDNHYYKVPTYGKIFKIIDFGRSIYKFKGQLFCSDSFYPGGDAATQYNFGPFYNKSRPRIDPNNSFDLCRLGTSIYDFIIGDETINEMNELQKTIYRWCLDDNAKNILYKKNGEERFPEFRLYKMIARTVHEHTPDNQLGFPFFSKYKVDMIDNNEYVIDIDMMPSYIH